MNIMSKWIVDSDHSVAAFSVRHMMIADVHGQFNKLSGTINFDPGHISDTSVEITIDASSIITGIQKRDDHLKGADFLDVEKYPAISFKSVRIEALSGNRARVTGDLSLHGVTRQVVIEAEFSGPVKDPFGGGLTMGFATSAILNRDDYGIVWNQPMEDKGVMVGREVRLIINLEADLATE
jgi:polyisoprenoid-binding protein YceI